MPRQSSKQNNVATREVARSIACWFEANARDLPWRRTRDPYGIWISEIMLQQTQVKTVIPYWERWMKLFPTIENLADASEELVLKAWEGLGYYSRARNLQRAAKIIRAEFGGRFPVAFDQVLALPGIGRYTAGAICSIAYGEPFPILDGNVARVAARLFLIDGPIRNSGVKEKLWRIAELLVIAASEFGKCSGLNQGLMELGATVCTPRNPLCAECPVQSRCAAKAAKRVHELPHKMARPKPNVRLFHAYIFRDGPNVLVRKRPGTVVNGGLWEFPNQEISAEANEHPLSLGLKPFSTIRHTITNNRITLKSFEGAVSGRKQSGALQGRFGGAWMNVSGLHALPFSSAHAKIRAILQGAHAAQNPGEAT